MKMWQAKLPTIPAESPLSWWMNFVESCYPWVVRESPWAVFVTGCSLIAQTTKMFIQLSRPYPCNFFLALIGPPGTGKGRILDCLNAVIANTWIGRVGIGSAEGIEEAIAAKRFCYIIIDEMNELVDPRKKSDYLDKLRDLLNRIHALDRIERVRRKESTLIEAMSYYVSLILAGQEHDWKNMTTRWKGGLERKVLPLRVRSKKELFRFPDPDPKAAEYLVKLQKWINEFEEWGIAVKKFEPVEYAKYLENLDNTSQKLIEEYTMKILAAVIVNNMFDYSNTDEISVEQVSRSVGQEGHIVRGIKLLTSTDLTDLILTNLTSDLDKNSTAFFQTWSVIPMTLISELFGGRELAEEKLEVVRERMTNYIEKEGRIVISKKEFVREILKTASSREYTYMIKALEDAEYIRTYKKGRATYVILDPKAPICANCKHFDKLCKLEEPRDPLERKVVIELFDPFQKCRNNEFEPVE